MDDQWSKPLILFLEKSLQCFLKQDRLWTWVLRLSTCYIVLCYAMLCCAVLCYTMIWYDTIWYVLLCYLMLYFHLYYIIVLFPGQLRSLVKPAWDSPAHRANPRIHQCLLLELIHHFAVVMTNKTQVICFSSEPGKRDPYSMALAGMSLLNCRPLYHCRVSGLYHCV